MKHTARLGSAVVGFAAALTLACNDGVEPQGELTSGEWAVDVCQGPNTVSDGGMINTEHDWNDMGVQDQSGYTGINSSDPNDQGVIAAEQQATAALDGGACIFGAHGGDPSQCGGQTSVQSLPHDTSQSILYTEYHPECAGKPLILSVCYGGQAGTNGYISIASAVSQNYGVSAAQIVACTGPVYPGVPMQCDGTIVDGNGNPIGNQTIGGLNIVQVVGPPAAGRLSRCKPTDRCPVCTRDGGALDAGTPDSGTPDSGTPDSGTLDAGTLDAGTPDAGTLDAGTRDGGSADAGYCRDGGTC